MSDRRFDDVVINTSLITGPDGKYAKSTCKTCSQVHKVRPEEFQNPNLSTLNFEGGEITFEPYTPSGAYDKDVLMFVSRMRAWNCCHEDEEPLDGFPEQEAPSTIEWRE